MDHNIKIPAGVKKIGSLYCTSDYSIFEKARWNRPVTDRHVDNLVKSIKKKNYLFACPIVINFKMQIVDGQHRCAAAKKLGISIYYIQLDICEDDIWLVNSNSQRRNTQIKDVIDFHVGNKKNEDYELLQKLIVETNLPPGACCALLGTYVSKNDCKVKNGDFKFKDDEITIRRYCKCYSNINDLTIRLNDKRFLAIIRTNHFCHGLNEFLQLNLNWEQFMSNLEKDWQMAKIYFKTSGEYKQRFIDIYNKRLKSNRYQ